MYKVHRLYVKAVTGTAASSHESSVYFMQFIRYLALEIL